MELKYFLLSAMLIKLIDAGSLRKIPKVYNALITSDENLLPSRAYPLIQPHIHELPITYSTYATYPLATDPFKYTPLHHPFSKIQYPISSSYPQQQHFQQLLPGFLAARNNFQDINNDADNVEEINKNKDNKKIMVNATVADDADKSDNEKIQSTDDDKKTNEDKQIFPILPDFGLLPNVLQYSSQSDLQNPLNLLPYSISSQYPLIIDQYSGFPAYHTNPYLPPFGYYPQNALNIFTNTKDVLNKKSEKNSKGSAAVSDFGDLSELENTDTTININDNIKNNKNRIKEIPDVPPPPLPSGAKRN